MYDVVPSGTTVPAPSLLDACTHYCVLVRIRPRLRFKKGCGVELYDAAVSGTVMPATTLSVGYMLPRRLARPCPLRGTAVPAPSLLAACTRCCMLVRIRPSSDYV